MYKISMENYSLSALFQIFQVSICPAKDTKILSCVL